VNQKTKKSTQNREYGVFANLRNPEKPHTPYWAIASGRLWEPAATSLKIEKLRRSLESELKTIPKLGISMVRSQGWKFLAIVNLKSKGGLLNLPKPQEPCWVKVMGSFCRIAITLAKIEKLVGTLGGNPGIYSCFGNKFYRWEGCSPKISTKSELKSSPLNKLLSWVLFTSEQFITNHKKPQKPYSEIGVDRFNDFSIAPLEIEKLVRSPSPTEIIIGVLFLVGSDRSQKIKVKSGLKSSPLNNLPPWMVFRGEQFIANDENVHNPCWKGARLKLWEFRCNPPKLKRSLFYGVKRIPVLGIIGGWEVAA
jgi:hypothetical protein